MAPPRLSFQYLDAVVMVALDDLVLQDTDAVVCPSNSYGHMRGGVSQALRLRGGDEIEEDARSQSPTRVGHAISTTAGRLSARRVYHAPTMSEPVEVATEANVVAAMNASLDLAWREGIQSISFPGMGTGTGRLSPRVAAASMLGAIVSALDRAHSLRRIHLVATSEAMFDAFESAARRAFGSPSGTG